jgi:hypothetical protein
VIEPAQLARFQREVKAMVRYAGDEPDSLACIVHLAEQLQAGLAQGASECRRQGFSWADIGRALGVTRQAAYQRLGKRAHTPVVLDEPLCTQHRGFPLRVCGCAVQVAG